MKQLRLDIQGSAIMSPCGKYRYVLQRNWGAGAQLLFLMLNPSTADADQDDPTIRRCISRARAEGFDGIVVCNLFAFRATDPKTLLKCADPVGPENDKHISEAETLTAATIAAWGIYDAERLRYKTPGVTQQRGLYLAEYVLRRNVCWCLGKTKDGYPRHPLYVPKTAKIACYYPFRTEVSWDLEQLKLGIHKRAGTRDSRNVGLINSDHLAGALFK